MTKIVTTILIGIFTALAAIHFYWAAGGQKWLNGALPATPDGQPIFAPSVIDSLVVGIGLLAIATYYLLRILGGLANYPKIQKIVGLLIPVLFLARAIGDFKYVGFFKDVVGTQFAAMDSKLYTPLCMFIAFLSFAIVLDSRYRKK